MARRKPSGRTSHATHHPGETLEEIESQGERMAQWITDNVRTVVIAVGILLLGAGGVQTYLSYSRRAVEDASSALEGVRDKYLAAMGASPGARDFPELANPDAAKGVREEFSRRFAEVAEGSGRTVQAGLAWLEAGNLLSDLGDAAAAHDAWQKGLDSLPSSSAVAGVLLVRIARAFEDQSRWQEAAESHRAASELEGYPLRFWAMADAARGFDRAGNPEQALELFDRVEREAPGLELSDALRIRLRELRAASGEQTPGEDRLGQAAAEGEPQAG